MPLPAPVAFVFIDRHLPKNLRSKKYLSTFLLYLRENNPVNFTGEGGYNRTACS
jgi:hypothetical protein